MFEKLQQGPTPLAVPIANQHAPICQDAVDRIRHAAHGLHHESFTMWQPPQGIMQARFVKFSVRSIFDLRSPSRSGAGCMVPHFRSATGPQGTPSRPPYSLYLLLSADE